MKKYRIILGLLFISACWACSEEDSLETVYDNRFSYFAPDSEATDEESILRRNFYETEKSYLLFNDTLRHEPIGVDNTGEMRYFTELLDLGYYVGSNYTEYKYDFVYMQTFEEKRASVDFLKEYILLHFSSDLRPFSWLLVKEMSYTNYAGTTYYNSINGERCTALALGDILSLTDDAKEQLSQDIIISVLSSLLAIKDAEMQKFFSISNGLYEGSFTLDDYYDEVANMEALKNAGFICKGEFWGFETTGIYPSKERDCNAFIKLVFNYSPEEVEDMYGDYPLVMEKYNVINNLITELGYIY